MAEEKELKEAQSAYSAEYLGSVEPIILKRDGQPVFALLPFEEYQRLRDMAEHTQAKAETSWKERFDRLLTEVHSHPTQYSPEEIEAEITAAREEVKEMRRARHGGYSY